MNVTMVKYQIYSNQYDLQKWSWKKARKTAALKQLRGVYVTVRCGDKDASVGCKR